MSTTPESFGRYQLLKVLARGGMGEVYLARQGGMEGFEKLVVLKRILPHLAEDEEFVHMFNDEAKIASNLNHPNVVQIYDLGREGDYNYIAMEYIHGEDVRRLWKKALQAGRKIPPALACRIIAEAAAGLDYAHKKTDDRGEPLGIVHRDVSPHNILVTFDGGVKVIDFGIARARNRMTHTATGAIKGRFEYMSPEHASGLDLDGRSDVFALGVVLWETLTGTRLFKRDSETATLVAVSDCQVPVPSQVNPELPPELDALVLKALARRRDDRYADAAAFRLALEEWLAEARKPASSAHLSAFMRDLYADRLANEQKAGRPYLEETTGNSGSNSRGGAGENQASKQTDAPPDRATSPSSTTIPALQPGPPRPPKATSPSQAPFVVAVLAVVVMGGVGALLALSSKAPPAPGGPVAVPAPPVPAPVEPVPATVAVHFDSEPAGAEVLIDGVTVGRTPMDRNIARSQTPVTVWLKLDGHKPYETKLSVTEPTSIKPLLAKADVAKAVPVPVAAPRPAPSPALDIKIAR